jgi:hypothetical protein
VGVGGLAIVACSGSGSDGPRGGGGTGGVMLDCSTLTNRPADCDKSCLSDTECTASYCENNTKCVAHCTATEGCGESSTCNARGRCVPNMGTGGTGNTGGTSVCGQLELATDRVIPNIMMIVDRSGSMGWDFAGNRPVDSGFNPAEERWAAVEEALVGTEPGNEGLVRRLDSIARFGLTLYWKPGENSPSMMDGDMCADTDSVAISSSLDNADAIDERFAANSPSGYTPTAEAVEAVTDSIIASPPPEGPTVYLLATDGLPNGCDQIEEGEDRTNSINAVTRAFSDPNLGIRTFVLGVSLNDSHLQDLANAGGGEYFFVNSVAGLQSALEDIVVQNIPCTASLTDGTIDISQACDGEVRLNGELLTCNDDTRGWRAVDGNTIELMGSACEDWRGGSADLKAVFPCYVVVQ